MEILQGGSIHYGSDQAPNDRVSPVNCLAAVDQEKRQPIEASVILLIEGAMACDVTGGPQLSNQGQGGQSPSCSLAHPGFGGTSIRCGHFALPGPRLDLHSRLLRFVGRYSACFLDVHSRNRILAIVHGDGTDHHEMGAAMVERRYVVKLLKGHVELRHRLTLHTVTARDPSASTPDRRRARETMRFHVYCHITAIQSSQMSLVNGHAQKKSTQWHDI